MGQSEKKVNTIYEEKDRKLYCEPQGLNFMQGVSYCCCNKLPLTEWLKTMQMYYLTILEARNPKWISLG